jgi:WD40 repeat protein
MAFSPGNKVKFGAPLRARGHGYVADVAAGAVDPTVDKYLVSVSRDQQYAVYQRFGADTDYKHMVSEKEVLDTDSPCPQYALTDIKKSHTRQVYAMTWCDDGSSFFTSSRDKHAKYWRVGADGKATCVQTIDFPAAATAMVASHCLHEGNLVMLLIAGFDNGIMHVYQRTVCVLKDLSDAAVADSTAEWTLLSAVDADMCHSASITRLITLPRVGDEPLMVASASNDHSVRVFQLKL